MACKGCDQRVRVKLNQVCLKCKKGVYVLFSSFDKSEGKLTCNACLHRMLRRE